MQGRGANRASKLYELSYQMQLLGEDVNSWQPQGKLRPILAPCRASLAWFLAQCHQLCNNLTNLLSADFSICRGQGKQGKQRPT